MGKNIKPKIWQMNVWVVYEYQKTKELNRDKILSVLSKLSGLYKLDYAVSFDQVILFSGLPVDIRDQSTQDLAFFRSTDQTPFPRRKFREIVNVIFEDVIDPVEGEFDVVVGWVKDLKNYPFPMIYKVG